MIFWSYTIRSRIFFFLLFFGSLEVTVGGIPAIFGFRSPGVESEIFLVETCTPIVLVNSILVTRLAKELGHPLESSDRSDLFLASITNQIGNNI